MPDLPRKKVGLIACSGEERAEGTVTRRAVRQVLEKLRPDDTVTLCLPLFLAGGEGERAFARRYPTIAVDGCDERCAARATERYSARPAASIVVTEIAKESGSPDIGTARRLNGSGLRLADTAAARIAGETDRLLQRPRRRITEPAAAAGGCSCGSGLPQGTLRISGSDVRVAGLPIIFAQARERGLEPNAGTAAVLLETVGIYNEVPADRKQAWTDALIQGYAGFLEEKG
ncbi:MAG TPA: putative zinc-binding protein [Candidatus Aminicenantes bacterium]|nr:putative zinc-binding protein [Candidatus Aminicenantes bacterium]HRY63922.1 putative zinc-binding protein [Candidatus Aminicenantes bacterium]HRZ70835.1 putative zinc-binding protein [Candidatus Aminicenantes bacterium]